MMKKAFCLFFAALIFSGCESVDSNRIPAYNVHLDLSDPGIWNTYGVSGQGQARIFNKETGEPAGFFYSETTYTGYGGILLVYGIDGPAAYDLACPVEISKDVRLSFDQNSLEAVCKKCGSRYNVFDAGGAAVYGKAVEMKYGLQRFSVVPSGLGYIIAR